MKTSLWTYYLCISCHSGNPVKVKLWKTSNWPRHFELKEPTSDDMQPVGRSRCWIQPMLVTSLWFFYTLNHEKVNNIFKKSQSLGPKQINSVTCCMFSTELLLTVMLLSGINGPSSPGTIEPARTRPVFARWTLVIISYTRNFSLSYDT